MNCDLIIQEMPLYFYGETDRRAGPGSPGILCGALHYRALRR
jgi:hypothetical protein